VLWHARGHADARAGKPERGDHVLSRVLAASPWPRWVSGVISSERGRSRTWCDRAEVRGEEDGMVVTMVIGMVMSLMFWCPNLVSGSMAWSSGVSPGYLTRLASLERSRVCTLEFWQSVCDTSKHFGHGCDVRCSWQAR
jgi:hypothetical protein